MKKDFFLKACKLVSIVDFIKWTSTFGEGMIAQIESPLSGVRLSAGLSHLFALGRDKTGWMIIMDEIEGAWLETMPIASVLVGASDGLIIITEPIEVLEDHFQPIGIELFIPQLELRDALAKEPLIGFGLRRSKTNSIERVNRIARIMTVKKYHDLAYQVRSGKTVSLFSA